MPPDQLVDAVLHPDTGVDDDALLPLRGGDDEAVGVERGGDDAGDQHADEATDLTESPSPPS
jgi:hypothetical protein